MKRECDICIAEATGYCTDHEFNGCDAHMASHQLSHQEAIPDVKEMVEDLDSLYDDEEHELSEWETRFVESMKRTSGKFTQKQIDKIKELWTKYFQRSS